MAGPTTALGEETHKRKYRLAGEDFTACCGRVASPLADDNEHFHRFRDILLRQLFIPAGRIQSAVGSPQRITAANCFVSGIIQDSMNDIMDKAKEAAQTMRLGGGIGYDFSTIRPRDSLITTLNSKSSGAVSFMNIYDAVCSTVKSAGDRRGAMMGVLRIDHPDIEEFIEAKSNTDKLTNFNTSVAITDEFMQAVENDTMFSLVFNSQVFKRVSARMLWDKLMRATYDWAEPGVLFIDTINKMNNLHKSETIASTNPCIAFDTEILTSTGYQKIGNLIGKTVDVWNGFEFSSVTPRQTGTNQAMVTVKLSDGSELRCTAAHKFILKDGTRVQANKLEVGTKLEKSNWPVINGVGEAKLDYYAQGFYSGDGWLKSATGGHYIGLWGKKKEIPHNWNAYSRNTYKIRGGYPGTDTTQTKDLLYFKKGTFNSKLWVPFNCSIDSKRKWLAGLADSDGTILKDGSIQISAKNYSFLADVKKLITTMGANCNLQPMRDCWRVSISASYVVNLAIPTLRLSQVIPSRNASRFLQVVSVEHSGTEAKVFCFTEDKRHSGVFSGVYTAQCGEQPLSPYGACLLGSYNATKLVTNTPDGYSLDLSLIKDSILSIVRALDNVIDETTYPLPQHEVEAKNKRRMGIGITGLANAVEACGFKYGSPEFLVMTEELLQEITYGAYRASIQLAKEKGSFPLFNAEEYLSSNFIKTLPDDIKEGIKEYGIRNSHLISFAPAGTISITADNVSSGIEPVFSYEYTRAVNTDGVNHEEVIQDYGYRVFGSEGKTADECTIDEHLSVLALVTKYSDSAVSKTINVGNNVTWEEFKDIYMKAWKLGCKGCTTFRASGKRYGILNAKKEEKELDGGACYIDPLTGVKECS